MRDSNALANSFDVGSGPKPGDFPIGSLESRAAMRTMLLKFGNTCNRHLFVVSFCGAPLDLATSTCTRTRYSDGTEWVIAKLSGDRKHITDEELNHWIESFPIKTA